MSSWAQVNYSFRHGLTHGQGGYTGLGVPSNTPAAATGGLVGSVEIGQSDGVKEVIFGTVGYTPLAVDKGEFGIFVETPNAALFPIYITHD